MPVPFLHAGIAGRTLRPIITPPCRIIKSRTSLRRSSWTSSGWPIGGTALPGRAVSSISCTAGCPASGWARRWCAAVLALRSPKRGRCFGLRRAAWRRRVRFSAAAAAASSCTPITRCRSRPRRSSCATPSAAGPTMRRGCAIAFPPAARSASATACPIRSARRTAGRSLDSTSAAGRTRCATRDRARSRRNGTARRSIARPPCFPPRATRPAGRGVSICARAAAPASAWRRSRRRRRRLSPGNGWTVAGPN